MDNQKELKIEIYYGSKIDSDNNAILTYINSINFGNDSRTTYTSLMNQIVSLSKELNFSSQTNNINNINSINSINNIKFKDQYGDSIKLSESNFIYIKECILEPGRNTSVCFIIENSDS